MFLFPEFTTTLNITLTIFLRMFAFEMVYNAIKGLTINTKYNKTDYYKRLSLFLVASPFIVNVHHYGLLPRACQVYRFGFKHIVSCIYLILFYCVNRYYYVTKRAL